jgi:hypothetical protein
MCYISRFYPTCDHALVFFIEVKSCPYRACTAGKLGNGNGKKQDLFFIFIDAVSVTNTTTAGRAAVGSGLRQLLGAGGGGACDAIQEGIGTVLLSEKDLEFVASFTQVSQGMPRWQGPAPNHWIFRLDGDELLQ